MYSYTGLMVVRGFLGAAEGGLLPGIVRSSSPVSLYLSCSQSLRSLTIYLHRYRQVLYLSSNYKRSEMAIRLGLIYSSASLSGAFGGLLALGLNRLGGKGGLEGWRWILVLEGLMTVVVGIVSGIFLPDSIETASFLTAEERLFAARRLKDDRPTSNNTSTDDFSMTQFWAAILSIQVSQMPTWTSSARGAMVLTDPPSRRLGSRLSHTLPSSAHCTASVSSCQPCESFGSFISCQAGLTIGLTLHYSILGLGYSAERAQLFSVPPYAVAAVLTGKRYLSRLELEFELIAESFFVVAAAFASDRLRLRGPIMLSFLPLSIIGYAVIRSVNSNSVKYGE